MIRKIHIPDSLKKKTAGKEKEEIASAGNRQILLVFRSTIEKSEIPLFVPQTRSRD